MERLAVCACWTLLGVQLLVGCKHQLTWELPPRQDGSIQVEADREEDDLPLPAHLVPHHDGVWLLAPDRDAGVVWAGVARPTDEHVVLEVIPDFEPYRTMPAHWGDPDPFGWPAPMRLAQLDGVVVITSIDPDGRPIVAVNRGDSKWESFTFPHDGLLARAPRAGFSDSDILLGWTGFDSQADENLVSFSVAMIPTEGEPWASRGPDIDTSSFSEFRLRLDGRGIFASAMRGGEEVLWRPAFDAREWKLAGEPLAIDDLETGTSAISSAQTTAWPCSDPIEHSDGVWVYGPQACLREFRIHQPTFQQVWGEINAERVHLGSIWISGVSESFVSLRHGDGVWLWWLDPAGQMLASYRSMGIAYPSARSEVSCPPRRSPRNAWSCTVREEFFTDRLVVELSGPGGVVETLLEGSWNRNDASCHVDSSTGEWLVALSERRQREHTGWGLDFGGTVPVPELHLHWGTGALREGSRVVVVPAVKAAIVHAERGLVFLNVLYTNKGESLELPELPTAELVTPGWTGESFYTEESGIYWFLKKTGEGGWAERSLAEFDWSDEWSEFGWTWLESGGDVVRVGFRESAGLQWAAVQREGGAFVVREVSEPVSMTGVLLSMRATEFCLTLGYGDTYGRTEAVLCSKLPWRRWR